MRSAIFSMTPAMAVLMSLAVPLLAAAAHAGTPAVDRYGQYAGEDWPGKVKSDDDLRADRESEIKALAEVRRDDARFDRYGALRSATPLRASGFFRTEKVDGRWWLVSPEGNLFYLKGVDAVPYLERGYFTAVRTPEGAPRELFTEGTPDAETYPGAWRGNGTQVNFLAANLQRKYGAPDFREAWMEATEKRLLSWGFNASAKWNNPFVFDRLPFLLDHGLDLRRFDRYIDPYEPDFETRLEPQVRDLCARYRDNPLLIGYQFENENGWSRGAPLLLLKDVSGRRAGKRALLERLAAAHGGDAGEAFGRPGETVDALMTVALDGTALPRPLMDGFIRDASRRYHETLARLVRQYDPNHLFLGASHCSHQSMEWIEESAAYVDVLPLHEYNLGSEWIGKTLAPFLARLDKPFAVLEFSFTNRRRGFAVFSEGANVATEADRGRAFQQYTEALAARPGCVGTGYFILHDQPVTRRGHDTEAFNFGLIDVVDRPYREMLPFVAAANARLEDIHAGRLAPTPPQPLIAERPFQEFMPGSTGEIRFDSSNPQFHLGRTNRLRFSGNARFGVPLPMGTVDAGKPGGFKRLEFFVFLWKNAKRDDPSDWFRLEESADNVVFTPTEADFRLNRDAPFREFVLTPRRLKPDTRYVRLSFVLHDPAAPWATSLAETRVERQ